MPSQLVILAAGVGRRFGGLKQLTPVGPAGETIMDYTVFDAAREGFDEVILVIRRETEDAIRAHVEAGMGRRVSVQYAFQELDPGRARPWGTVQAVLAASPLIDGPFAVANADDVYGPGSFARIAEALARPGNDWAMVGFRLEHTLSPHGSVSRALCRLDAGGRLLGLEEHPEVTRGSAPVSKNLRGLRPQVFDALGRARVAHGDCELFLPTVIGSEIAAGRARVDVIATDDAWMGVTWEADLSWVRERLAIAVRSGRYPSPLW